MTSRSRSQEYQRLRKMRSIESVLNLSGPRHYTTCPLHDDHSPSFSIYFRDGVQKWRCHTCDKQGDVIDLVGYMKIPGYNKMDGGHVQRAAEALLGYSISLPKKPPPLPELPSWLAEDMLPPSPAVIQYARSRGLTPDSIRMYDIGTPKGWMVDEPYNLRNPGIWMSIPTYHNDNLMGIKLRNIGRGLRYLGVKGSRAGLWGYNDVALTSDPVLVVKGEIAAMILRQHGFLTCAPTNGERGHIHVAESLAFAKVIVIGDNDEKPSTREKIMEATNLRARNLHGIAVYPPPIYKGVDDWVLKNPDEAIPTIQRWIDEI